MKKLLLLLFYALLTFTVFTILLLSFKSWLALISFPILIILFLHLQEKPFQLLHHIIVYLLKLVKDTVKFLQLGTKNIISSKTNIQIVLLTLILLVVSFPYLSQLFTKTKELKKEQQRINENRINAELRKHEPTPTLSFQRIIKEDNGYIEISPYIIQAGEKVAFEYGYKDTLNNEHLNSAVTTVTVEIPSKKKYTAINGKAYPDDFSGASTSEVGKYWVHVERTIETTSDNIDTLYSASSQFIVNK